MYGTTPHFLEHFGFESLESLPRPEKLPVILRDRLPLEAIDEAEGNDGARDGESASDEPDADASAALPEPGAADAADASPRIPTD